MQTTKPAIGQLIEPAFTPFYSEGYGCWCFRDYSANLYGAEREYPTKQAAQRAIDELLAMARAKGARI